MDIEIQRGDRVDLFEDHGISVLDFLVSSIPLLPNYTEIEGSDRLIDGGAQYGQRTITVPFQLKANSLGDFPRIRDLLFSLVQSKQSFYIRELRRQKALSYAFVDTTQPAMMDHETNNRYANGKQYLVRLQSSFSIDQIRKEGEGELVFETTELPFAESIGTTADIDADGLEDERLWTDGMGLDDVEGLLDYSWTSETMSIYNAGTQPIHPYQQQLKITIDNLTAGEWLELENLTTGEVFRINEDASGKTIVLDGPNVTANGLQYYRNTNRRFLTLASGWNEFEIRNTTSRRVSFDFVFYYD